MLKKLNEQEKQEIREALERWIEAARETAKYDPEFAEALRRTPFHGLVMKKNLEKEGLS